MNVFTDLVAEEMIKCQMFWHSLTLLSVSDTTNELKNVLSASDDQIKSGAVVGVQITYKEVHSILKKATTSKSHPFQ